MRNRQNLLRNKSLTFWGHLNKDGFTETLCLLCSITVTKQRGNALSQSDRKQDCKQREFVSNAVTSDSIGAVLSYMAV